MKFLESPDRDHDRDVSPYLILINIDFHDFILCFLLSFRFDREDMSNFQDRLWPHFQTPRSPSKILRDESYFPVLEKCGQTRSFVFGIFLNYQTNW